MGINLAFYVDNLNDYVLLVGGQSIGKVEVKLKESLKDTAKKRLEEEIIEITGIIEDGENEEIQDIESVNIENVKYIGREKSLYEEDEYDVYEGEMFYYRVDGTKKYFSYEYYFKNNISYYKVNPVKIICISEKMLRIVNTDDEGLYCYAPKGKNSLLRITDKEPEHGSKNYKDILYYRYELESEQTLEDFDTESGEKIGTFNSSISNDELIHYTEVEQKDVIEADISERILINAGPGTGKTWTLIEKIIYLVKEYGVDAETIQVLCFSRAAVDVIRKRIKQEIEDNEGNLAINRIDVRTFDSFATQLLYWVRDSDYELIPENFKIEKLSYDERIQKFTEVIKAEPDLISSCNHLVIDEVQDLVLARADMVLSMIKCLPNECGITLLGDSCQAIYDYQLEDNCTSINFYKEIMGMNMFKYYSFSVNQRQTAELIVYSDGYREHLLNEDISGCQKYVNILKQLINTCDLKLSRISKKNINSFIDKYKGERTAILTRNNAQALKISGEFRKKAIDHCLVRKLKDRYLQAWIAVVFNRNNKRSYNFKEFSDALRKEGVEGIIELWNFFSNDDLNIRLDTKDILKIILEVGTCTLLYINDKQLPLTVSTIHRSKGREYDNVIILDDLLDENEDTIEEHRVKYVALSRARKKIFKTNMDTLYFKTLDDRRCIGVGVGYSTKKKYLSHFEIGLKDDLIINDFTMEDGLQEWIRDNATMLPGKEIYLSKQKNCTDDCIYYDVILAYNNKKIGRTSMHFFSELTQALRKVYRLPPRREVYNYMYPTGFKGGYISDIASEISLFRGFEKGVQNYGSLTAWNIILIEGYARAVYDKEVNNE